MTEPTERSLMLAAELSNPDEIRHAIANLAYAHSVAFHRHEGREKL